MMIFRRTLISSGIACLLPFPLRNVHVGITYAAAVGFAGCAGDENLFLMILKGIGYLTYLLFVRFVKLPGDHWPLDKWHTKQIPEQPLNPKQQIIDPHHHLWDVRVHDKGWPVKKILIKFLFMVRPSVLVNFMNKDLAKKKDGLLETFSEFGVFYQTYMAPELLKDMKGNNVHATVYVECG